MYIYKKNLPIRCFSNVILNTPLISYLYVYIYIYIDAQRKTLLVNVSTCVFISFHTNEDAYNTDEDASRNVYQKCFSLSIYTNFKASFRMSF